MGAYAALLSLSQTLEDTLHGEEYPLLLSKQDLLSLQQNVSTLVTFLHDISSNSKFSGAVKPLESRIVYAAYHAEEHVLGVPISSPLESCIRSTLVFCISLCFPGEQKDLKSFAEVLEEIDSILEDVNRIKNSDLSENEPSPDFHDSSANSSTTTFTDVNTMVFEDDFSVIKGRIYEESTDPEIIPIVGMGGIGKTTLARRLYEDAIMEQSFDRFIWIAVSQCYSFREILLRILRPYMKEVDEATKKEQNGEGTDQKKNSRKSKNEIKKEQKKKKPLEKCDDRELKLLLHQELYGRSYLVVLDDVWSLEAWDELNQLFPRDITESRILVTTRSFDVATTVGSKHEIHPLSADQSWQLLRENIFRDGSCPSRWQEKLGTKIAGKCRGLPLTIVVVAGLLKGNVQKEYWEHISRNIGSAEPTIHEHCSKVLALSYENLPLYLKPCFLYVAAFPDDIEIAADRIIMLWVAEGLVRQPSGSESLEEVAGEYLDDLVSRSLLIISKRIRYSDKIEKFIIHDLLRDFAVKKVQEEKFYCCLSTDYMDYNQRRFSFNNTTSLSNILAECNKVRILRGPLVIRSLLVFCQRDVNRYCFGENSHPNNFTFLKVWDTAELTYHIKAKHFVHLKYLSVDGEYSCFPRSVSHELQNLQTLIIRNMLYHVVGLEYWRMPSLRHVIIPDECYLQRPGKNEILVATNLRTLPEVRELVITTQVIAMFYNLRKLSLHYSGSYRVGHHYQLSNLIHLRKLEELQIVFSALWDPTEVLRLSFPSSLKKLSLRYVREWVPSRCYPHILLSHIQDLEVLEIEGCISGFRKAVKGEFSKLKCLKLTNVILSDWLADELRFPSLEILVLEEINDLDMEELDEIPGGIGRIDTLEQIELHNCNSSVVKSAREIQADKEDMGHHLQLRVTGYTSLADFNAWVAAVRQKTTHVDMEFFIISCWHLWSNRNKILYESAGYDAQNAVQFIQQYLCRFREAQAVYSSPRPPESSDSWEYKNNL